MKIRIGKELRISWSILTQGQNQPLEGRNLRLYLQEPNRQRRTLAFTYDANTLLTVLPANTLTRLGNYALILTENEGQEAQTAVDANPAFTLVETTEEEDTPTTESPSLEIAHINLATGNLTLRMVLQELFSGKEGGDLKTGDILPVLRDGELHRVSAAAVGGGKMNSGKYKGVIHKAVPVYPREGYAYIFRGWNFIPVFRMDSYDNLIKYVHFFRRIFKHYRYGNKLSEVAEIDGNIVFRVWACFESKRCVTIFIFNNRYTDEEIMGEATGMLESLLEEGYGIESIKSLFITVFTNNRFGRDNAFYIKSSGAPIYESEVELCSLGINDTEMISQEYKISQNRCVCVSIPSVKGLIRSTFDTSVVYIDPGVKTRIFLRKTGINRHRDWYPYKVVKSNKHKKRTIKLEAGETRTFRHDKIRGTSIHSIITTHRHISKVLGGVKVLYIDEQKMSNPKSL